jgi:hypothetical protein
MEKQMPTRRRGFRRISGAAILLLLGFLAPAALAVIAPSNGINAGITPIKGRFVTEPAGLALLGSGFISLSFLIRRFQLFVSARKSEKFFEAALDRGMDNRGEPSTDFQPRNLQFDRARTAVGRTEVLSQL